MARGDSWEEPRNTGNSQYAVSLQDYAKMIKPGHFEPHVTPIQTMVIFLGNLMALGNFIDRDGSSLCTAIKD